MKRVLTVVATLAVALVAGAWRTASGPAPEDGVVTSLSVVPASGRAEVLIGVGGAVSIHDFALHNPERVVVDISGASLRIPTGGYDQVDRGGVLGVRYSQFSRGVVRVVVSLNGPHHYSIANASSQIRVSVEGTSDDFAAWHVGHLTAGASAADLVPTQTSASVTPVAPAVPLRQESVSPPVPVRVEPRRIARAPLRVSTYDDPSAQQQPRITVTWENADIRDVIAAFSMYSGRTIILSKGVEATKISATITDQPWDVALRVVLNANGLDAVQDPSGILIVDTQDHIRSQRAAEPLVTRSLRLNYVKAINLKPSVEARLTHDCGMQAGNSQQTQGVGISSGAAGDANAAAPVLTNLSCPVRGAVTVDTTTNTMSVTDIGANLDSLVSYAKQLDIRQPQVNIKAKIILVDRTSLEALGLQYDIGTAHQYFNDLVDRPDSTGKPQTGIANRIYLGGNTLAAIANASQQVPGAALKAVYSAAMGGFSFTSFIQALTTVSLLDVQAEPSVTTLNNYKANLTAGTQVPIRIIDASSQGGTQTAARATVQMQQTGIILTVTPQITANHQVQMLIHAENSDVQQFSNDVGAVFPRQFIDNTMLVADGQTAIMGGLTQTSVTISKSGIPVLVDLPIIGRLFGFTQRQEVKRDLLILITPHIVDDGQAMTGGGGSH